MVLPGVMIVGCGNIAGGYDAALNEVEYPLSHAGAYCRNGGFELLACVEPDTARRASFMARWGVAAGADSMQEFLRAGLKVDVIAICSPTALHAGHLAAALEFRPRLVVCEKPVTPDTRETRHWVERYEQAGVALLVNHTRRWAPDVVTLAAELADGTVGALRSISGIYNKGLLNNGSHMLDLLRLLCGELQVVAAGAPQADFFDDDPTVPFMLRTGAGVPVSVNLAHAGDFAVFELQLVTSRGVIVMEDGGLQWRRRTARPSSDFPGYRSLDFGTFAAGEYRQAMSLMVANQWAYLQSGASIACTGRDALAAQELCARLLESAGCAALRASENT
jgi:predicted dehydrogenase